MRIAIFLGKPHHWNFEYAQLLIKIGQDRNMCVPNHRRIERILQIKMDVCKLKFVISAFGGKEKKG